MNLRADELGSSANDSNDAAGIDRAARTTQVALTVFRRLTRVLHPFFQPCPHISTDRDHRSEAVVVPNGIKRVSRDSVPFEQDGFTKDQRIVDDYVETVSIARERPTLPPIPPTAREPIDDHDSRVLFELHGLCLIEDRIRETADGIRSENKKAAGCNPRVQRLDAGTASRTAIDLCRRLCREHARSGFFQLYQ